MEKSYITKKENKKKHLDTGVEKDRKHIKVRIHIGPVNSLADRGKGVRRPVFAKLRK